MSPLSVRNVRLLALFNFFVDFRLYGPVLIIYFAQVSGSYALGTSVLSLTMLTSAILDVPTSVISDRVGRVPTTICGAAATVVAVTLYSIAHEYWVLLAGGVVEGIGRALYSGNNQALLFESLASDGQQDQYHHHAGRVGSMFQLALAISAIAGGLVAQSSLRWAVWLSVPPQIACLVVALFMREPKFRKAIDATPLAHLRQAFTVLLNNRQLRRLVIANAVQYGSGETGFQMQPAFIRLLWPTWGLGVARFADNGFAFLSFWFSGRVINRFGATKTLLAGQVWGNLANLVALLKPTGVSPAMMATPSLVYGTSSVAQDTLQQHEFSDRERATIASIGSLLGNVIFAVVVILAGIATDKYGLRFTLLACETIGLAGLPLLWKVHRLHMEDRT
jgi:MFS family permease